MKKKGMLMMIVCNNYMYTTEQVRFRPQREFYLIYRRLIADCYICINFYFNLNNQHRDDYRCLDFVQSRKIYSSKIYI